MRTFQRFFVVFCAIIAVQSIPGSPLRADEPATLLKGCGCTVTLPEGFRITARNDRLLVAQSVVRKDGRKIPVNLRFLCAPNTRRTSMITEIRDVAREKNMNIRRFVTFELTENVEAAVFFKSRFFQGRIIQNAEGYFATRANEYFLYLIPETGDGPLPSGMERELLDETRSMMERLVFFASITPTITEANYRLRYYGFIGLVVLMGVLGLSFVVLLFAKRIKKRRTARESEAEDAESDDAPGEDTTT